MFLLVYVLGHVVLCSQNHMRPLVPMSLLQLQFWLPLSTWYLRNGLGRHYRTCLPEISYIQLVMSHRRFFWRIHLKLTFICNDLVSNFLYFKHFSGVLLIWFIKSLIVYMLVSFYVFPWSVIVCLLLLLFTVSCWLTIQVYA